MSSTSESPSFAATVTALLALTTPFVAPPGCPRFTTTSIQDTSSVDGVAAVLVADDPSCHPDGWADVVPESRMSFSPGVCPSGWVYHAMGEAAGQNQFTAACCESGYTLIDFEHKEIVTPYIADGCGRWTSRLDDEAGSGSDTGTGTITGSTLLLHRFWRIAWDASDTPTLTPQPPSFTSDMWVPTWTPGEVIPDGKYDSHSENGDKTHKTWMSLFWFLVIGLPIIGILMIGSCVFCCVRNSKKKKAARRTAALEVTAGGGSMQSESK